MILLGKGSAILSAKALAIMLGILWEKESVIMLVIWWENESDLSWDLLLEQASGL